MIFHDMAVAVDNFMLFVAHSFLRYFSQAI
jgi:hypothetical protein